MAAADDYDIVWPEMEISKRLPQAQPRALTWCFGRRLLLDLAVSQSRTSHEAHDPTIAVIVPTPPKPLS